MSQTKLRDDQMSFNVSTGHDHDGSNSKQIAYANVTGTPTIPTVPSFESSASNIKADGTASAGSLSTVPRADHVHPIDDTGWIAPTLLNSWVNYGSPYAIAGYRKIGNVVYLRGLLITGSSASAVFFTLPSGYRPAYLLIFSSFSYAGACRIDVNTNGDVNAATNGSTSFTSLDGISFLVA